MKDCKIIFFQKPGLTQARLGLNRVTLAGDMSLNSAQVKFLED